MLLAESVYISWWFEIAHSQDNYATFGSDFFQEQACSLALTSQARRAAQTPCQRLRVIPRAAVVEGISNTAGISFPPSAISALKSRTCRNTPRFYSLSACFIDLPGFFPVYSKTMPLFAICFLP